MLVHQDTLARIFRTEKPRGLRVVGEIDLSNAEALRAALAAAEAPHITVDLSACTHLGSAAIGALIDIWQGGQVELRISAPSPTIRNALEISGITRFPGIDLVDAPPNQPS